MISASHNPYYDNGIKLINSNGEKMDEETILLVEDYIDGKLRLFGQEWKELPYAHKDAIGCTVDYVAGRNRYMGYLISLGVYSFKGMKVGLDCANGSSWNMAKSVFEALGAKCYVINNEPNGLNINNNAGSTHIEGLQKYVVDNGLDVGFAYDGDADRCLCVDELGNVITGDHILYIYGKYMKERGKLDNNTVVTTVMSNFGLYKALDELGIGYAKTAVGDKYVYEYMQQNGCRIGGEQSGHIIFSKYASTGDGILTSLKMMEVMMARKQKMSQLCEGLNIYPQVLQNVRVADKAEALAMENWNKNSAEALQALNDVRARVGLPARATADKETFLEYVRHERKVELAGEGFRYWDLRRWRLAEKVIDGQNVHGVKISKQSDGSFTYEQVDADGGHKRIFYDRYYRFAIPLSERSNNSLCTNNDGWI